MIRPRATLRDTVMLALIGLALAVRVIVPAGWMPDQARGFAITLCTGSGAETAWIDSAGNIHKRAPATAPDRPCDFAGVAAPMLGGDTPVAVLEPTPVQPAAPVQPLVAIDQGLAAPPPPATGPPATV